MFRRVSILALAMMVLLATAVVPVAAKAAPELALPVTGQVLDENGDVVGEFEGTVTGLHATNSSNLGEKQLTVRGLLEGVVTLEDGTTQAVSEAFTTTADAFAVGECAILDLDLGPIHLDLLGLVVDLNALHLDVTAVPGAGNLLGNLLCGVVGLLDENNALAQLINQILAILGGLGL